MVVSQLTLSQSATSPLEFQVTNTVASTYPRTYFEGGDSSSDSNWVMRFADTYSSGGNTVVVVVSGLHWIENLVGNTGVDNFIFLSGGSYAGNLNGAGNEDVLNYSAYGSNANVILTALGSMDGFAGTTTGLGGTFTNLDILIGGAGTDSLTGMNATAIWELDGSDRYFVGTNDFEFSAVENLIGGAGVDTFVFANAAVFNGSINGGGPLVRLKTYKGTLRVVAR